MPLTARNYEDRISQLLAHLSDAWGVAGKLKEEREALLGVFSAAIEVRTCQDMNMPTELGHALEDLACALDACQINQQTQYAIIAKAATPT